MEKGNKKKSKNILIGLIMFFMIIIIVFISMFYALLKDKNTNKEEDMQVLDTQISEAKNETSYLEENEVYAKILKNEDWIISELEYNLTKSAGEFLILDINKDGVNEMLLRFYGKEHLDDGKLTVISYDTNAKKIIKQNINMHDSNDTYLGYLENEQVILSSGLNMGDFHISGYKFDNNECTLSFTSSDNSLIEKDEYEQQFKINSEIVSKDEYDKFRDDIAKNLSNKYFKGKLEKVYA